MKYPFDYHYQVDILKVSIQDPVFLSQHPGVVQPQYFSADNLMTVARLIIEFFEAYKEPPGLPAIRNAASNYFAKFKAEDAFVSNVHSVIDTIYSERPYNANAIKDTIRDFAQEQSVKGAVTEVLKLLEDRGNLAEATEIMRRASQVGTRQRESWSFREKIKDLRELLLNDPNYRPESKIKTAFSEIDIASNGGIGIGQIWTVAAKPKGGKTTLMTNIGVQALFQGKKVYHYSFGDMDKVDVMNKYAMCLSGMTQLDLVNDQVATIYAERALQGCQGAELEIIYESPGVMDVGDLYTDLSYRVSRTGISPDLVIVDYANKMRFKYGENSYRSMSIIYEGLKELGDAFSCGILTGVQIRRKKAQVTKGGEQKNLDSTPEDVAESWLQVADCDALIIINQTEREVDRNMARLSMPIVRRGAKVSNYPISFRPDIARMTDQKIHA